MIALILAAGFASALERPAPMPGPLELEPFVFDEPTFRELSNGIRVVIVENHELPLWEAQILFATGSYADPAGKEGLSAASFDAVEAATADMDASAVARKTKELGAQYASWSRADTGYITVSGITRTMAPSLDLFADIIREPAFNQEDVDIVLRSNKAKVASDAADPNTVASEVMGRLVWGDTYNGRITTEESVASLTRDDVAEFYATHAGPENAFIMVGGDVDPDTVTALLEERLGDWAPEGVEAIAVNQVRADTKPGVYFVDQPGASQSVIRSHTSVGVRQEDDAWFDLLVANQAYGGAFTARVNMNLREDKGYTYGARCYVAQFMGPAFMGCSTSVRTDVTRASLDEIQGEWKAAVGDRPLTAEEVSAAQGDLAYSYPGGFETTDAMLDVEARIWRYGVAEDWVSKYIPGVQGVSAENAAGALAKHVKADETIWVIVGDRAEVFASLADNGLQVYELDKQGNPKQ